MRRIFETRITLLRTAGPAAYIKATSFFLFPDWWIHANAAALAEADERLLASFPPVPIAISRCHAVMNFDCVRKLGRIATPTLVFCAEDDFLTPSYFARELAEKIPHAQLRTIPRGGMPARKPWPRSLRAPCCLFWPPTRAHRHGGGPARLARAMTRGYPKSASQQLGVSTETPIFRGEMVGARHAVDNKEGSRDWLPQPAS